MFRIKHLIPTAAVLIASAAVIAPAAQAQADGLYPSGNGTTTVVGVFDPAFDNTLGARVHDTPLAKPVVLPTVTSQTSGRIVDTSGGIDWTFPVMGAIAIVLVMMVAGDQLLFRRRGQLAT
jgi:hypothetical protein